MPEKSGFLFALTYSSRPTSTHGGQNSHRRSNIGSLMRSRAAATASSSGDALGDNALMESFGAQETWEMARKKCISVRISL